MKEIVTMNKSTGLVSVLMAAYNAENTIEVAITSVLGQSYTNWELIIVDDFQRTIRL